MRIRQKKRPRSGVDTEYELSDGNPLEPQSHCVAAEPDGHSLLTPPGPIAACQRGGLVSIGQAFPARTRATGRTGY